MLIACWDLAGLWHLTLVTIVQAQMLFGLCATKLWPTIVMILQACCEGDPATIDCAGSASCTAGQGAKTQENAGNACSCGRKSMKALGQPILRKVSHLFPSHV